MAHQVGVLDLDVTAALALILEQHIDAARLAVLHLAPRRLVTRQLLYRPGGDGLGDEPVGLHGIDADEDRAGA